MADPKRHPRFLPRATGSEHVTRDARTEVRVGDLLVYFFGCEEERTTTFLPATKIDSEGNDLKIAMRGAAE